MGLVVGYDDNNEASGSLFWDEGDTVGECQLGYEIQTDLSCY